MTFFSLNVRTNKFPRITLFKRILFNKTTYLDGFFLDQNESDAIYLDDIVFRDLTPSDKDELELQQYYG